MSRYQGLKFWKTSMNYFIRTSILCSNWNFLSCNDNLPTWHLTEMTFLCLFSLIGIIIKCGFIFEVLTSANVKRWTYKFSFLCSLHVHQINHKKITWAMIYYRLLANVYLFSLLIITGTGFCYEILQPWLIF